MILQSKLESTYGIDAYVDTTRTDGTTVRFPERLMKAIDDAPVFVCVLGERDGEHTLQSEWVLKEIQQAYDLHKFCIPVFQQSYRPLPDMPPAVDYLLGFDGVHIFDQTNVMVDESVRKLAGLIEPHRKKRSRLLFPILAAIVVIGLVAAIAFFALNGDRGDNTPTPTRDDPAVAQQTASAVTQASLDLTTTATLWTATPTPTPNPEDIALAGVNTNAAWQPFVREVDGVEMVLVPAGCFEMGSEDGDSDERPIHSICFDEPFWIDKYEVTQGDFARLGGTKANASVFTGDNRPVERITWVEARDFCELRNGRLPTEAEWEYAARGPDGLVYPWGNDFIADNAVYSGNSGNRTALVGSRAGGVSWVGAYDMSGNVWEWTSTIYQVYPYNADESRESNSDTNSTRSLRGGSWDYSARILQATNRIGNSPDDWYGDFGFRCVRSY